MMTQLFLCNYYFANISFEDKYISIRIYKLQLSCPFKTEHDIFKYLLYRCTLISLARTWLEQ